MAPFVVEADARRAIAAMPLKLRMSGLPYTGTRRWRQSRLPECRAPREAETKPRYMSEDSRAMSPVARCLQKRLKLRGYRATHARPRRQRHTRSIRHQRMELPAVRAFSCVQETMKR